MLPGAGPRPLGLRLGRPGSFERLVFAEVADGQAQRIDGDQLIRHMALKHKDKVPGIQIALELAVICGRIVDQVEIDAGPVGRILHFFQRDFFDVNVDLGGGAVGKEFPVVGQFEF